MAYQVYHNCILEALKIEALKDPNWDHNRLQI